MSIFKTKTMGYRDVECLLSIAAIFPPEKRFRLNPDGKTDDEAAFHLTITNNKDMPDERSAYIQLAKEQLRSLNELISDYLKTGITTEI